MPKSPDRYLKVDPWKISEEGFEHSRSRVSESMFCLANEFMGVRGYFDEGYSGDRLLGSYFNNLYEEKQAHHPQLFKGIVTRECFGVNSVDTFYTRISVDGETLDLAQCKFSDFVRTLDMYEGTLTRSFVWSTRSGKKLRIEFQRFLSMKTPYMVCQKVSFEPLNFSGKVQVRSGLDYTIIHEIASGWDQTKIAKSGEQVGKNFWSCPRKEYRDGQVSIIGQTEKSGHLLFSSFRLTIDPDTAVKYVEEPKIASMDFSLSLKKGSRSGFEKIVVSYWEKSEKVDTVWKKGKSLADKHRKISYETALAGQKEYWAKAWEHIDMPIEGDDENLQGVRFSIFNLYQTYHGFDPGLNIPCKGLTAEVYYGAIFWDTETYCMPFYMFNNPKAARNLLLYRHKYLPQAIERAKQLDCEGARYPMVTLDGTESCSTWQHGDFEIHVSVAIAYAIWHYYHIMRDDDLLFKQGIEMLLQICRFYASWGDYSPKNGDFCLYGVMGPDEYHMNVNNNCYTNMMVKKCFEFTVWVMDQMKKKAPEKWAAVAKKVKLRPDEPANWKTMARKMRIPMDRKTGIYEQHDGYFDLPEVDVKHLPESQIPIYKNWAYLRIFRKNMIKQPDTLLLMLFYGNDYNLRTKKVNYEYYEARTIHESSLSPGVHSILATELGKHREAFDFFKYMARMDLDNYNKNTDQGLHVTSMSGAYLNMVFGFGGLRTDDITLSFTPYLPKQWKSFQFQLTYLGSNLKVRVGKEGATFTVTEGQPVAIKVYGKPVKVTKQGTTIKLQPLGVIGRK